MPKTLRLSKKEEEALRKKCIEINKILVGREKAPLKDSELAHIILEKSIGYVRVNTKNEIIIDN